jgi:hypothetical protein
VTDVVDTPAHALSLLARRVEQLGQRRMTPESFHTEKSEIVSAMRRLSARIRDIGCVEPTTTFHRTPADADAKLRRRPANDNFFKAVG